MVAADAGHHRRVAGLVAEADLVARSDMGDVTLEGGAFTLAWALSCLAGVAVRAGVDVRALSVEAEGIVGSLTGQPEQRAQILICLVGAAVDAGDHGHALALAADAERAVRSFVEPHYNKSKALTDLAMAFAYAGDHDYAMHVVQSISNWDQRAWAQSALAVAAASAHEHDRAERIARSIADPEQRARALIDLAEIAEPARARSLVAEALAVGPWTIPSPTLARIDASILFAFVDRWVCPTEAIGQEWISSRYPVLERPT